MNPLHSFIDVQEVTSPLLFVHTAVPAAVAENVWTNGMKSTRMQAAVAMLVCVCVGGCVGGWVVWCVLRQITGNTIAHFRRHLHKVSASQQIAYAPPRNPWKADFMTIGALSLIPVRT